MVNVIISGAQTGSDRGGLKAAKKLGIPTGGWMPKGCKTEKGYETHLLDEYDLLEHPSEDYISRTKKNISFSDGTIIFGRRSPGSNRTEEFCRQANKPCMWVPYPIKIAPQKVRLWLVRNNITCLNVAGNRESVSPGIEQQVQEFLERVLA